MLLHQSRRRKLFNGFFEKVNHLSRLRGIFVYSQRRAGRSKKTFKILRELVGRHAERFRRIFQFMTYQQLLQDPRWDEKRKEILKRDGYQCRECESKECELHVHHHYYLPGMMPWEYEENVLITLCAECHEKEEFLKNFDLFERQYLYTIGLTRNKLALLCSAISKRFDPLEVDEINTAFSKIINKIKYE